MIRRLRTLFIILLFIPHMAGATGTETGVMSPRILALTPHACEMLYAIGAGEQVVGAVSFCDYPEQAKRLLRIGSYERINVEAALRLKPDLAVVLSRNVVGVEMLEKMGVTVMVSNPDSFESMFADILKLGDITRRQDAATTLVSGLRKRLQKVRALPRSNVAVFYEVWHDPMLTAGGPSFISDLIHEAGGRNIFADIAVETPHVNVEAVIRARPELIVIPLEKRNLEERRTFWEGWLGRGNIRFAAINPDLLHRPGPRLLDGLELLQQALQEGRDGK